MTTTTADLTLTDLADLAHAARVAYLKAIDLAPDAAAGAAAADDAAARADITLNTARATYLAAADRSAYAAAEAAPATARAAASVTGFGGLDGLDDDCA